MQNKETKNRVYLSFGNFNKVIFVEECTVEGNGICPVVAVGATSGEALSSELLRRAPGVASVRFNVNNTEDKEKLLTAYYAIAKHVCNNCQYNGKNKTK